MKCAAITGIAGQHGTYLARGLLRRGYEVHGLLQFPFDREEPVLQGGNFVSPIPEVQVVRGMFKTVSAQRRLGRDLERIEVSLRLAHCQCRAMASRLEMRNVATVVEDKLEEVMTIYQNVELQTALVIKALRASEWQHLPIENACVLDKIRTGLTNILSGTHNEFGVIADRSKFIADLGQLADQEGLAPSDPALRGTVADITSEAFAEIICGTVTALAQGFTRHTRGMEGVALQAAPAQELVRIRESREKRRWVDTWRANGGRTFPGDPSIGGDLQEGISGIRCVALKGDPIWSRISRFSTPYPPFDFNSGVSVESLTRREAIDLGLIALDQIRRERK